MTRKERALKNLKQMCSDGRYLGSGSYAPLEVLEDFDLAIKALEQEPKTGHWINKQHLFESCSAECSSCHKQSNGYMHDNGFSLECKYYDFCPKCGSDNREVEV